MFQKHSFAGFFMAPTFSPSAVVPQLVAQQALYQLNRKVVFTKAAMGDYEPVGFQRGDAVTVRRAKIVTAQDYDPRSGSPATKAEPGYASSSLTLERLFTAGFPVYGQDSRDSIERYVPEYSRQIAQSIAKEADNYLYNKFRTYSIASTGNISYGFNPPVGIVAAVSGQSLAAFDKSVLTAADYVLSGNDVPADDNRFAIISNRAKSDFLNSATLVEGFTAAQGGATEQFIGGLPNGMFVNRYGFNISGSNAVTGQTGVTDLDTAVSTQGTLAIASVAANTAFTLADYYTSTSLGALDITLTCSTGLSTSVVVGQICRIAPSSTSITGWGVILRIDRTTATAPVVTAAVFSSAGVQLTASQITAGTDLFSVPTIGSISVAYHKEALLYACRDIVAPSPGAGAVMAKQMDEDSNLSLSILNGSYQVDYLSESSRAVLLMGALLSDHRKACLILSQ